MELTGATERVLMLYGADVSSLPGLEENTAKILSTNFKRMIMALIRFSFGVAHMID